MSIKSDHWIRRQAAAGMIEPFEPGQVREIDGRKIVSYGTSSYGYDVRCAGEFKIFTNINSTIVDPKAFDPASFVDVNADVCIIPPNSFALARTVEYFRIPRSTLVVCLGKCVTGDTRVVDADTGAYLPITEMRFGRATLALEDWQLKPASVTAFMVQGRKPVFELQTRSGLRIRATANHPFRQLDGWKPLGELQVGDRIAAAREVPVFGHTPLPDWEASLLGMMIAAGQCATPGGSPVLAAEDPRQAALLAACVATTGPDEVTREAVTGRCPGNDQSQGEMPPASRAAAWLAKYDLNGDASAACVPQAVFMAPRESVRLFLQSLFAGDGGHYRQGEDACLEYCSKSRRLAEDVQHLLLRFGVLAVLRDTASAVGAPACSVQITDQAQILRFAGRVGFVSGSIKQRRLEAQTASLLARDVAALAREACQSVQRAAAGATARPSVSLHEAPAVSGATGEGATPALADGPLWDVVESIQPAGEDEVYDISISRLHNFLANGLIVHNSTYARCFRGDTQVALANGSSATLEDMARRADSGEVFFGYSIGAQGRMIVSRLEAPRYIGRDSLLEIELDDGAVVHATPDHLFLTRDGRMVAAQALRAGDSLMPLYRQSRGGHETAYQPLTGQLLPTHQLGDEWNLRHGTYAERPGAHRHHLDQDRRNNYPTNIVRLDAPEQLRRHDSEAPGEEFDAARRAAVMGAAWAKGDRSRGAQQAQAARRRTGSPGTGTFAVRHAVRNHKVASIRPVTGVHDVFCLTVPEAGNFALQAGVFVRNCGIIVNVTPLEPEWEGHVTLEFSNTTTLPAKIYAHEGVAQMLFFESDEVCSTSYADRAGKYQGQRGVTLPKT